MTTTPPSVPGVAATERPAIGSTVRAQIPGKRAYAYVVVEHSDVLPGAFRAARPSRTNPGDYFGGSWLILPEWVIPYCPHGCGSLRWVDDSWYCSGCGDAIPERKFETEEIDAEDLEEYLAAGWMVTS